MIARTLRIATLLPVLLPLLSACAKSSRPLPGDSVATDGAVTLSPARMTTAPREAVEALGAIECRLYPPELVMEHQGELGIEAPQRDAISREVERGQSEILHLQWELQSEKEKLVKALDGDKVDEAKTRDAAARVMDRENRVKASHLTMLVRVKNLLTGPQQQRLRELRPGGCGNAPASGRVGDDAPDAASTRVK